MSPSLPAPHSYAYQTSADTASLPLQPGLPPEAHAAGHTSAGSGAQQQSAPLVPSPTVHAAITRNEYSHSYAYCDDGAAVAAKNAQRTSIAEFMELERLAGTILDSSSAPPPGAAADVQQQEKEDFMQSLESIRAQHAKPETPPVRSE